MPLLHRIIEGVNPVELALWSCMTGGLLTITLASLCDAALSRSAGAFMGFTFVALLTLYAVLLCGVLQFVFPTIPAWLADLLQVGLGPLCSTIALVYTGRWLSVKAEDEWITNIVAWGTGSMAIVTVVLSLFAAVATKGYMAPLLQASAGACLITVVLTGVCAWRASMLGDPLAKWIAPSAIALTVTISGLYTQAVHPGTLSLIEVAATAFAAVAYLLIIASLSIVRTRQVKQLERLAGLQMGADPVTGLATGSAFIAKVDDAFWRASRYGMACNVVCMHLHNLYELAEQAGHGVEQQIALAMSARIRRAVGFRCVVGLYHARCFIAVIQVPRQSSEQQIQSFVQRLHHIISKPVDVVGFAQSHHQFAPDWGVAVVSSDPNTNNSAEVLRQAEHSAMQAVHRTVKAAVETPPIKKAP